MPSIRLPNYLEGRLADLATTRRTTSSLIREAWERFFDDMALYKR